MVVTLIRFASVRPPRRRTKGQPSLLAESYPRLTALADSPGIQVAANEGKRGL